jgi:hypothetical protein
MRQLAPLLTAVIILAGAGLVHGLWTQRWQKSYALEAAVARLDELPTVIGDWQSEAQPVSAQELALAGAEGSWVRHFTAPGHAESILVMILCGRTNAMCAHRPENCYGGAGFELTGAPLNYLLRSSGGTPLGEFWTGKFVKEDAIDGVQLRFFWSWLADGQWKAPSWPRYDFAGQPYLYKLYVIRDATVRPEKLDDDPLVPFLRQLIPTLTDRLALPRKP